MTVSQVPSNYTVAMRERVTALKAFLLKVKVLRLLPRANKSGNVSGFKYALTVPSRIFQCADNVSNSFLSRSTAMASANNREYLSSERVRTPIKTRIATATDAERREILDGMKRMK